MTGLVGGSGGGGGYDYVQDPEPAEPSEGEEWYDTGDNKAFVYDGAAWIEQTVTSHGALSGLSNDDHPQYATDTKVDNHAADGSAHHAPPSNTEHGASQYYELFSMPNNKSLNNAWCAMKKVRLNWNHSDDGTNYDATLKVQTANSGQLTKTATSDGTYTDTVTITVDDVVEYVDLGESVPNSTGGNDQTRGNVEALIPSVPNHGH